MSNIIPYTPNAITTEMMSAFSMFADINKDIVRAQAFPHMSIKGKVFTLNKDGVKSLLTRVGPDGEKEAAQAIGVVILRANMNAKTFYMKKFDAATSDNTLPDCYSMDGIAPSPNVAEPQAKKCAICPQNQWGSRIGDGTKDDVKGRACADNARLAIATPDDLESPMLLRVPPASLKPLREMVKELNTHKVPYSMVVTRISFDPEAASPKLMFKSAGVLPVEMAAPVRAAYDSELVCAIVGATDEGHGAVADEAPTKSEAAAAEATTKTAKPAPAKQAKPVQKPAEKATSLAAALDGAFDATVAGSTKTAKAAPSPAKAAPSPAKAAPSPAEGGAADKLLADLSALVGNFDD